MALKWGAGGFRKESLAALAACCLAGAAANAEDPTGAVTLQFDLSNGTTVEFVLNNFIEEVSYIDPENPQSLCAPPLIRSFLAQQFFGQPPVALISVELDFNEHGLNRPIIALQGTSEASMIAVDLRADSTPEELSEWLPETGPRREAGEWLIETAWDFSPSPVARLLAADPLATTEEAAPNWIDLATGEVTDLSVDRVRVDADLRVPATYPDPDTSELHPCT